MLRRKHPPKLCSTCRGEVCDFCIHFAYNGGDGAEIPPQVYMGDGFCKLDRSQKWPEDGCVNFVCGNWIREQSKKGD